MTRTATEKPIMKEDFADSWYFDEDRKVKNRKEKIVEVKK
jgi:hypothetical protein